uniref:Uncharacterized protein n=1 Tax=Craspedostauros australis TaxID=1486917 RepID=A0A7R9ZTE4_9STRA
MQKVRRDKAEVQIEQLLDRIDECEEEMVRMRQSHADEVKGLQSKIDSLATATVSTSSTDASSSDEVAALKKELAQSRKQVESLKRSKQEIIESYEQLMNEGDEEEEEAAEPKRKRIQQNEDEENGRGSRSNGGRSRKGKQRENNKAPLQVLSNNVGVPEDPTDALMEKSGDDPQWLFPKIPSMQDGNSGKYKRPVGRAPLGREWDGSVGAWRKYRKTAFGSA